VFVDWILHYYVSLIFLVLRFFSFCYVTNCSLHVVFRTKHLYAYRHNPSISTNTTPTLHISHLLTYHLFAPTFHQFSPCPHLRLWHPHSHGRTVNLHSCCYARHKLMSSWTYLLTSWSRVLEKLTGFATSQEFPRIYETRKFMTVFTSARHLSLSWARSIQSPPPRPLPEDLS
jgi:hypothetical protein